MAKYSGLFPIEGTIGDLCFYKTKHGYIVRRKSSIDKKRIRTDPAYARVRKNGADFGTAARAGKLIRSAFRPLIQCASDPGLTGRLTSTLLRVIQADQDNPHGERTVQKGDQQLLEGFEFNQYSHLANRIRMGFTVSIDRTKCEMTISTPPFLPAEVISAPRGATHFRLFAGGAAIDFKSSMVEVAKPEGVILPINKKRIRSLQLVQKVKRLSSGTLVLVFGIEFLQMAKGKTISLMEEGFNSVAVAKVNGPQCAGRGSQAE